MFLGFYFVFNLRIIYLLKIAYVLCTYIIFLIWSYNKLQNLFLFVWTNPDPGLQIHL